MKKLCEKYWAVRIGNPRHHFPYLMISSENVTPVLFLDKEDADRHIKLNIKDYKKFPDCYKAVRVKVEVCR